MHDIACKTIEDSLSGIYDWCQLNKLTVNSKKTKHMLVSPFCGQNSAYSPSVKMGNDVLDNVKVYNYLGVSIDSTLSFNVFLKEKCEKVNVRLYQLAKMRKFITSSIACTIYEQVIMPQLDYADFLIDSGSAYYINRLGNLHEKALRLIDCKAHRHKDTSELKVLYTLDSPKRRRKEHHCAIMYRLSKKGGGLDKYRPETRL